MQPTIFDLCCGILVITGARLGFTAYGCVGGAVACVWGATLGILVGYALNCFLNRLTEYGIRRTSTPALRAKLVDDVTPGTYVSSLIISVLLERGEPVDSFRDYIFRQLHSEYVTWRKAGLYNLELCYPHLAAELDGFNPFQPTDDDWQRLEEIESAHKDR